MRISQKVANYTAGQADGFRKAMGKKKPEVLAKEFVTFEAGMKENGFSSEAIKALWDTIEPFAAYAFNKSHAAGYRAGVLLDGVPQSQLHLRIHGRVAHLRGRPQR